METKASHYTTDENKTDLQRFVNVGPTFMINVSLMLSRSLWICKSTWRTSQLSWWKPDLTYRIWRTHDETKEIQTTTDYKTWQRTPLAQTLKADLTWSDPRPPAGGVAILKVRADILPSNETTSHRLQQPSGQTGTQDVLLEVVGSADPNWPGRTTNSSLPWFTRRHRNESHI